MDGVSKFLLFELIIAVDCGELLDPEFGMVSFTTTTFGSNSTYACSPGYLLNGPSPRTCLASAEWSGNEPTCEREYSKDTNMFQLEPGHCK